MAPCVRVSNDGITLKKHFNETLLKPHTVKYVIMIRRIHTLHSLNIRTHTKSNGQTAHREVSICEQAGDAHFKLHNNFVDTRHEKEAKSGSEVKIKRSKRKKIKNSNSSCNTVKDWWQSVFLPVRLTNHK